MRNNKLTKNIRLLRLISKTFRLKFKYIFLFIINTFLGWLNSFFFFLDKIFFPSLRKQKLDKPIYLIGHLRSGTTFLHRFLSKNCSEIRTMHLLEMIIPPLTLKRLINPFVPGLNKISLDKVYDPKIHKTGLNKEETDDIALYFRFLDGMLSWIYFHAWQEFEGIKQLHTSLMNVCNQTKFVSYLRRIHSILAFQSQKRVLSKSFSSLFYLEEMQKENTDGKYVIIIRDPKEAIPSLMSLEESVQNKMHGKRMVDKNRDQYFKNLYQLSVFYYSTLEKTYERYKDNDNFLFLSYDDLRDDFVNSMQTLIEHCELSGTADLMTAIAMQSEKQSEFKSKHEYSLEKFNLTERSIEENTPFYKRFIQDQKEK